MLRIVIAGIVVLASVAPSAAWDPSKAGKYGSTNFDTLDVGQLTLRGAGASGEGSNICVKAKNASVCRPLAERAADAVNVLDRGIDRTGSTDATSPIDAALAAASVAGTGAEIPGGLYRLNGWVDPTPNVTLAIRGARFTGGGGIHSPDWSAYITGQATGWIRKTNLPGTEFGIVSSFEVYPTDSPRDYQKGAGYFSAKQYDPSLYQIAGDSKTITRDLGGVQATCEIAAGNMRGRCWGGSSYAVAPPGSRGSLVGWEADVMNRAGIDQPLSDQIDSSTGFSSVIFTGRGTTAYTVETSEGGRWYRGYVVRQDAVLQTAFGVLKSGTFNDWTFRATPDGALTAASLTTSGSISATDGLFGTSGTIVGDNALLLGAGTGSNAASVRASAGSLSLSGAGTNPVFLGSAVSPTVTQGAAVVGASLAVGGAVGFNGATPVGKCTLAAALPTDGSATAAAMATAINGIRSCLITNGLAQ